ncbi:hypothetical protein BS78_02G150400 [Paspalum vaginatum]|nr:hypothetical protein BS78_02G150400 [Paspalum vaginatum]
MEQVSPEFFLLPVRGRRSCLHLPGMEPPTSPLDGTISKLPWKLDRLLRLPRGRGCILPKGVEDEIPLIKRDLEKIVSIISNLQLREQDDSAMMVRCWRKEVRELSYDMEDFVDQYEHAAAGARSLTGSVPRRSQRRNSKAALPWLRQKLRQRLWMANKIREFSVRAQEALQRCSMYNLDAIVAGSASSTRSADASSSSWNFTQCGGENDYVGINDAMEKLEELLMMTHDDGHQRLKVVSIVGFGGIGKTTLANELYHKIGLHFECRAFVRTSRNPDMRRIFISILSQVCPHQLPENWTVHSLISTIKTHLQDKRYLIVIEDVWAASTWDILKLALPDGNCCSRILTTTEIEDLALHSCGYDSMYVFKMKPLGDDDSRKLFFSLVFGPQHECPPELKEVSYDIIQKCGGLPLAIVTIASIFAGEIGIKEKFDFINKSLCYTLISNPTLEGMKQVLDLSYNNLPQNLKACILYTSLYEEDAIIWRDDLVNQWIAEGFTSATGEQDNQEIARAYFDELVRRKMFQPVYVKDTGDVLSCVVHHMVLNLITTYKSTEENFVTVIHHSQATTTLADRIRRLSLQYGNAGDAMQPKNMRLSQARTLAYFGVIWCMPSIVEFRLLQVLILQLWGDKDSIMLDLTRISELFRLRYLKVSSNVTLELHPHMQGLKSLETLTIDARVKAVPSDIIHLGRLLHLNLLEQTNLPNGIGHMMSLQTLGCFDISTNMMENVHSLGMLTNLRDLRLTYSAVHPEITNDKIQLLLNSIVGRLSKLNSLTLVPSVSSYANSLDDVGVTRRTISGGFSSMSCASTIVQSLKVSPRICMFLCPPKWIRRLLKLSILKIGVRKMDTDGVGVLGGLPALAVLSLYVQTKPAARIVIGKTGFPVIKYFKFKCCDPLLKFEEDAMPNLHKLKIVFNACNGNQHSTMPVGIRYLSDLKEVSAKIGGADPDDSYRMAAELAFRDAIGVHARYQRVNIQCVKHIIGCMGEQTSIPPEEEYENLKQKKNLDEKDSHEHDEIMRDSGEEVNIDADCRSTLSELHILLLLRNKLDNLPDDITQSIPIIDVYSYDPWKLAEIGTCHGGLFFVHPMQEARGAFPIKTPSGYWEITGLPGYIYSAERLPIGTKKTMEFYSGHVTSGTQTKWKIKEFIAFQNAAGGAVLKMMV